VNSDFSEYKQDKQDDEDETQYPARNKSLVTTVRPCGNGSEKEKDAYNEKNSSD